MISKNILSIVNKYNENGIYFLFHGFIWWFNGKRKEKWCHSEAEEIYFYQGKLYDISDFFTTLNQILNIKYEQFSRVCYDQNGYFYGEGLLCPFGKCKKNGRVTILPQKVWLQSGFKMLYYDNFVYYFSNEHNEKFDIQKDIWFDFKNNINYWGISDVGLLNGLFYVLYENGKISIYNPKLNSWQNDIFDL